MHVIVLGSVKRDQRLGKKRDPLAYHRRSGKKLPHVTCRQQIDHIAVVQRVKSPIVRVLHSLGKKLKQRYAPVQLHREPIVRSGDKPVPADSHDFIGHGLLTLDGHVLDHGVAEHYTSKLLSGNGNRHASATTPNYWFPMG